jgi:F0F1-type ATP synthase membrane subunit b/b'
MLSFLLDPSVSLALSFCFFFLFLGKKIGIALRDMISEYVQAIKSQHQKAEELLHQATKSFEEAKAASDNQERHKKEIMELARAEVQKKK